MDRDVRPVRIVLCFAPLLGPTKTIPEQIAQAIERRGQQEQTK
jgi:hypothetical protein